MNAIIIFYMLNIFVLIVASSYNEYEKSRKFIVLMFNFLSGNKYFYWHSEKSHSPYNYFFFKGITIVDDSYNENNTLFKDFKRHPKERVSNVVMRTISSKISVQTIKSANNLFHS